MAPSRIGAVDVPAPAADGLADGLADGRHKKHYSASRVRASLPDGHRARSKSSKSPAFRAPPWGHTFL